MRTSKKAQHYCGEEYERDMDSNTNILNDSTTETNDEMLYEKCEAVITSQCLPIKTKYIATKRAIQDIYYNMKRNSVDKFVR